MTRPFDMRGSFSITNGVFDEIMPRLSPAGWKILCVAIRQTWGWQDLSDPSGRRQWDRLSYSQFKEKSGIAHNKTVSRALQECIKAGYLLRRPVGTVTGTRVTTYTYALNRNYDTKKPGSGNDPAPGSGNDPAPGSENDHTNIKEKTTNGVVVLTAEQEQAFEVLLAFGFQPRSDAEKYARTIEPEQVIRWIAFCNAKGLGPGYLRLRFDAGDPAPEVAEGGDQDQSFDKWRNDPYMCHKCWTYPCRCEDQDE